MMISTQQQQQQQQQHPRLDLIFDINKTILLEDPAGARACARC